MFAASYARKKRVTSKSATPENKVAFLLLDTHRRVCLYYYYYYYLCSFYVFALLGSRTQQKHAWRFQKTACTHSRGETS